MALGHLRRSLVPASTAIPEQRCYLTQTPDAANELMAAGAVCEVSALLRVRPFIFGNGDVPNSIWSTHPLACFEGCSHVRCGQTTPHRTHTRVLFLVAHARTPDVITHVAQSIWAIPCVSLKNCVFSCHVFVECSFGPCDSALVWTFWPSGPSDPKHRLRSQVLHRCQLRAHAVQPSDQKHEFPERVRRDDHRL